MEGKGRGGIVLVGEIKRGTKSQSVVGIAIHVNKNV